MIISRVTWYSRSVTRRLALSCCISERRVSGSDHKYREGAVRQSASSMLSDSRANKTYWFGQQGQRDCSLLSATCHRRKFRHCDFELPGPSLQAQVDAGDPRHPCSLHRQSPSGRACLGTLDLPRDWSMHRQTRPRGGSQPPAYLPLPPELE